MRYAPNQIARVVVDQAIRYQPAAVIRALEHLLVQRGQLRDFPLIRAAVDRELSQRGLVTVETARPLPDTSRHQFTKLLARSRPARTVRFTINEQLGGGYRVFSARGVVEVSTANILKTLAKHLTA